MFFTKRFIGFRISDNAICKAANIVDRNIVEGIAAMVPITVEGYDFIIKWAIVCIGRDNVEGLEVLYHLPHDIAILIHDGEVLAHFVDILWTLVGIVGGGEQRNIMPCLFAYERTFSKPRSCAGVKNDITNVIKERLFSYAGRFSIEYHDVSHSEYLLSI